MSAERIFQVVTAEDATVNLLVLGCSINEANAYAQTIRNSGMAVHLQTAYNPDELEQVLASKQSEVVLVNCDAEEIDFTTAIKQIREVNQITSFILLSENPAEQLFFAAETRAQDIIRKDDYAHLIYVVSREHRNILIQKKLQSLSGELENTVLRCQTLTETASEPIAYVHEGMHVYANPSYVDLFKFKDSVELEGLPIMDLVAKDDRLKFKSTLRALSAEHRADDVEIRALAADGSNFPISMSFSPAVVDGEACTQVIVRNLSPDANLQKRLAELANFDMDTGLYNRKYFMNALEQALSGSEQRLSMLLVDVGNFGDIKTKHGLDGCDNLLKDITKTLSETIYDSDLLARFGEHDFTILCTPGTDAVALANRLLHALKSRVYKSGDQLLKPSFGIGIAHSDNPPCSSSQDFVQHLHSAAKEALEHSEQIVEFAAKNPASLSNTETIDERMLRMIDQALGTDQFRLVFQPVVSLHGNSREDYAIYVRLLDDNGKMLMPADFMPAAEAGNRMAEIDRWVIRNAVREVADKRRAGQKINFLVSISSAGIQDDSLLLWICDCLREFKAKGAWLSFQLKQRDVIRHLELVEQLVEGLKKINCRIVLDHFQCEQEAVGLAKHIGVDFAKFAPEVCRSIATDKDQAALLSTYNQQLQSSDIKTIVTAIEEASQLTVLWKVGVDYIQGNFIQEPMDTIAYDVE